MNGMPQRSEREGTRTLKRLGLAEHEGRAFTLTHSQADKTAGGLGVR